MQKKRFAEEKARGGLHRSVMSRREMKSAPKRGRRNVVKRVSAYMYIDTCEEKRAKSMSSGGRISRILGVLQVVFGRNQKSKWHVAKRLSMGRQK